MMSAVKPVPEAGTAVDYDPFADGTLARVVPTTEPQREIWLADQLGRDASLAFNESVTMRFKGRLDVDALRNALQGLVDRHGALRANLGPEGDSLCILDVVRLELPTFDYAMLGEAERDAAVAERLRLAVETPFALQHDRLFRAELLDLGNDDHLLILTAHHIVCDGWSWWVLTRELAALYGQGKGVATELPTPDDFADYALAEAARQSAPELAADEAYWLSRFQAGAPVLDLPTDRSRPARRGFASAREDFVLDARLVAALRAMGAARGTSLFATLLAGFAALMARLSGQTQVVVGIPAAGQAVDGHERLVGHCVNTLPLLFDLDMARPPADALGQAQATLLDALDHQRCTFGTLMRKLKVERDPARLPLISVMFNIDQALDHEHAAFPGLEMEFASNPRSFENFELFVNAVQVQGQLRLECQYNRELFDAATVRRWLGHWNTMLQAMVDDGDQPLGRLPLLAETERRQVLEKWNGAHADFATDRCIQELFEEQVERTPDKSALRFGDAALSYAELNARANQLAHHLRAIGAGPDDLVAICAERGLEMVVGLFAILKAGAAYVPIDPVYPAERIGFMLRDSGTKILLVQEGLRPRLGDLDGGLQVVDLSLSAASWSDLPGGNLARDVTNVAPHNLAYVIYTSGSTGKPKGVMIEHAAACNYLQWARSEYEPVQGSVVSSSFSFDATVTSLFTALLCGGTVRIIPERQEIDGLLAVMQEPSGCGLVKITPAHLDVLGKRLQGTSCRTHVETFVVGGEALPPQTVRLWHDVQPGVRIVNEYGPTETVVGCCVHDIKADEPLAGTVPIGRPIANMRIYILDAFGEPVPVGVTGEIHIGGASVARGYLNLRELSGERFVADPFARQPGARMYRTGDLGRWLADGVIEYLGRNDFQVKVRGYRVEPGEIEKVLASHTSIAQAVVIKREDRPGDARLVAYLVAGGGATVDVAQLPDFLRKSLPDYMVPQHFVLLDAIPLTSNGKVERKALPVPDLMLAASERVAPRNDTESRVLEAMEQILGLPGIGIHDDFFALGGHSLLAAQLTTRLNRDFGANLSLRSVFDAPTAERLATVISADAGTTPARAPIVRRARQDRAPLSLMQERCRLIEKYNPGSVSYNGPSGHRLTGPLDVAKLDHAFRLLAQRQTVLRTTIAIEDGLPVQVIHDEIDPGLLPVVDLSHLPPAEREAELASRMRVLVEVPFSDLSRAPLFSARLFKLAEDEHALFFMPHHIIWDGWSFDLLYSDIAEIYAALVEDRPAALPELPVTYGDFAAWHCEWIKGEEYARQVAFWREFLGGPNSRGGRPQALPTDKPRKRGMSGKSNSCKIEVPATLVDALHATSRRMDVTLFVTLLSAYYVLLARTADQRDMVIGTPVRGRNSAEVEGLMGYFTNLLPLRVDVDPGQSFDDFVRVVRGIVLDSFANPDVRLEDLARELSLPSEGGGTMLYQALFSFQDVRQRVVRWGNIDHQRIEVFTPGATEDLGLWFVEGTAGLSGGMIYNADILEDGSILRLRDRYLNLLAAVAADPSSSIADLFVDCDVVRDQQLLERQEAIAAISVAAGAADSTGQASGEVSVPTSGPTPAERYLLDMWSGILETEVTVSDNFFDLGGNSMLAVQMAERVAKETGMRIKLMQLAVQSLGELAACLPADAAPGAGASGGRLVGRIRRLFGSARARD